MTIGMAAAISIGVGVLTFGISMAMGYSGKDSLLYGAYAAVGVFLILSPFAPLVVAKLGWAARSAFQFIGLVMLIDALFRALGNRNSIYYDPPRADRLNETWIEEFEAKYAGSDPKDVEAASQALTYLLSIGAHTPSASYSFFRFAKGIGQWAVGGEGESPCGAWAMEVYGAYEAYKNFNEDAQEALDNLGINVTPKEWEPSIGEAHYTIEITLHTPDGTEVWEIDNGYACSYLTDEALKDYAIGHPFRRSDYSLAD